MPAAPDFPPAPDRVAPQRALISLSDKTGLEAAAHPLINTATTALAQADFRKFLALIGREPVTVVDFSRLVAEPG